MPGLTLALMRAWIEMPAGSGWGAVQVVKTSLAAVGYTVEEMRGTGNVLLRLSGSRLEAGELWRMPGQMS